MERHLVVWCPDLLEQNDQGREARAFARVVAAVGEFSPCVRALGTGACSMATRGPSRYFGGDEALAGLVAGAVAEVKGSSEVENGVVAGVGIADGIFGAVMAARSALDSPVSPPGPVVVTRGGTPEFLSSWPVTVLDRPELADLLFRLGINTLGGFARLPAPQVLARFGTDGAVCRAVAAGTSGELPGLRARLPRRNDEVRPSAVSGDRVRQLGFFGADAGSAARARGATAAVQALLHPEAVLRGKLQGGRGPSERARLVPWGERGPGIITEEPGTRDDDARPSSRRPGPSGSGSPARSRRFRGNASGTARDAAAPGDTSPPWPGHVPSPSPVLVLGEHLRAELVDANGEEVEVDPAGMASSPPARLSLAGGEWTELSAWAGPWPSDERWWSKRGRRRQARMQVVTSDGAAYLLVRRRGWWVEGVYD